MKIDSPAEDRIIVELSKKEMKELDITYEQMDYSALETRKVIRSVLDAAGKALGIDVDFSRRMLIEAIPEADGGCILSFTMLGRKISYSESSVLKKQSGIMLCSFPSAQELMNCANAFPLKKASLRSSLYELDGSYRLIISGAEDMTSMRRYFGEYCNEISLEKNDCEFTDEHWNLIAAQSALELLIPADNSFRQDHGAS